MNKINLRFWLGGVTLIGVGRPAHAALGSINMTQGVTDISHQVYHLHMLIFWICVIIGAIVFGAVIYSVIRYRRSKRPQAAQFHENTTVEILWTVVPFLILLGMVIPATKTLIAMDDTSASDLTVKITGYQWKWHYDYIDQGIGFYSTLTTPRDQIYNQATKNEHYLREVDNELVLPVGKKVRLLITANDVIHAWWVPAIGFKRDAVPGFINEMWTQIEKPGVYRGQCAELCGRDHAFMPIVIKAVPQEEFDAWVTATKGAQPATAATAAPDTQG